MCPMRPTEHQGFSLCRRRDVPGLQTLDAVRRTSRWGQPRPTSTSARIRHGARSARTRSGSNAASRTPGTRGGGQKLLDEFGAKFPPTIDDGQYRRGKWWRFSKAIKVAGGFQRSRCASAAGPADAAESSAACRSRSPAANLSGAGEGHDRPAEGVGPYDDEKLGFYRSRHITISGWWEAAPPTTSRSICRSGMSCRRYKAILRAAAGASQRYRDGALRCPQSAARKRLVANGTTFASVPDVGHGGVPEVLEHVKPRHRRQIRISRRFGTRYRLSATDEYCGGGGGSTLTIP